MVLEMRARLDKQAMQAVKQRFEVWRNIDPGFDRLAMFVASDVDSGGITWTEQRPSKVAAARFTSLATAAANLIQAQALSLDCRDLFEPNLADYDFIIHLIPQVFSKASRLGQTQRAFRNLQTRVDGAGHLEAFNPMQSLMDEL